MRALGPTAGERLQSGWQRPTGCADSRKRWEKDGESLTERLGKSWGDNGKLDFYSVSNNAIGISFLSCGRLLLTVRYFMATTMVDFVHGLFDCRVQVCWAAHLPKIPNFFHQFFPSIHSFGQLSKWGTNCNGTSPTGDQSRRDIGALCRHFSRFSSRL